MKKVYADLDRVALEVPEDLQDDEEALKEWIWRNCKDQLLNNVTLTPDFQPSELEKSKKRLYLLDKIAQVQRQFLQSEGPKVVFGCLLEGLLELMDSEYGFIGEVKYEADGTMYLQTHAITNIAWNAATRAFYQDNVDSGLKFNNMKSLFGTVMVTKEPVISNTPKSDKRACGIPQGHPPLNHFLGIPFFKKEGGEMNGMVGISNKPGGYSEQDVEFLEPFTVTCSNLIQAYWQRQQNRHLVNTLEEKVVERTQELELANQNLEDANQRVLRASAAQLEHFACMSHEIRTPLNCVIGLSSLLQETSLTPMQNESLKMIVTSGDLLLAVVNDVLDYSKLETGNVDIEIRLSNLQDTLDAIVHSLEMKGKDKNLIVRTFYDTALPEYVHTDNRRLQQILYNLLGNATKFSKEGGAVELGVCICQASERKKSPVSSGESAQEERQAEASDTNESVNAVSKTIQDAEESTSVMKPDTGVIDEQDEGSRCPFLRSSKQSMSHGAHNFHHATSDGSSPHVDACPFTHLPQETSLDLGECNQILRFVVRDFGEGISEKDFERIFKPFLQANSDTERLYGGTGLGLAITSKLVNALGGTISVDSQEGKWTRFTVDFPFVDKPADVEGISKRLSNATIFLIIQHNPEKSARFGSICSAYNVKLVRFQSLDEMVASVEKNGTILPDRSYICLCHEDLYRPEPYQRFASMAKSVLLTYGPKYSVKEASGHYRSLLNVIPCVLMQSMSVYLDSSAPVSNTTAKIASSMTTLPPIPYGDLRVLIAEDNLINQKVLSRMLKRIGFKKVDIVDNGQAAVEKEASKEYDVIFMDMQMPVMDGTEACRRIVERRGERPIPKVVFLTAHVENSFEAEAAKAGSSGFISKPSSMKEIEECFQKLNFDDASPEKTFSKLDVSLSNLHVN